MTSRHSFVYVLFVAVAASLTLLGPRATHSAPAEDDESAVPAEALAALRDGRYLRASLILRDYLASGDSTPSAILLAAQAEAGWGDWERVRQLLEGRSWLDGVGAGFGWNLLGRSQLALGRYNEGSASLGRFLDIADEEGGREQAVTLLRRAQALVEQRDVPAALDAYERAALLLPSIGDWIQVFAASAAAAAGDTAGVRERLMGVDATLASEWAWRTEVRARRNARDLAGAQAAAERAAQRLSSDTRRAAAWMLVGSIREERRDLNGARAAYIRAMNVSAASFSAVDAARALARVGSLSPEAELLVGRVYLRHGNAQRGVAGLTAYLAAGRGSIPERDRLLYDIAEAHFRAGSWVDAEKSLLTVARNAADRAVAADALFTAARAQYRDGRAPVARTTLQHIIDTYPDQPAAAPAAYLMADLDHDAHNLTAAAEYYRQVIRFAPASEDAALARMRLGGMALAEGRHEDALREFDEYRASHRSGRNYQQATYWYAQALLRLDREQEARARLREVRGIDPFSYYGGLAADDLGLTDPSDRFEVAPPANGRYAEQVQRALARVDLLRAIGWDEAATFEMERVRRHFTRFDGASYELAEALNDRGFTATGIAIGREIHRREGAWNRRLLRIVYPFPFRTIIVAEAAERGVDPFLAAALIRQESLFDPRAQSGVGARGLMQVMPPTGAAIARQKKIPRFRDDMLFQPELNVHFGMTYLAEQLRVYGRLDAVLASYNAGPGRVSRWRQFPEWQDRRLFAERIPFQETRDYVRIVQNNRRLYAAAYPELAASGSATPARPER